MSSAPKKVMSSPVQSASPRLIAALWPLSGALIQWVIQGS